MAQQNANAFQIENQLFFVPVDTKMAKVLENAQLLLDKRPEIVDRIAGDLIRKGKTKKLSRIRDKRWAEDQTPLLAFDVKQLQNTCKLTASELSLETGCPGMKPELVLFFIALNGLFGSVTNQRAWDSLRESVTLRHYLERYDVDFPGRITVYDNINAISEETLSFILDCQLEQAGALNLDDFSEQTIDSTSVRSSSAWPTDISVLSKLLSRVGRNGCCLRRFGIRNFRAWHFKKWFKSLSSLEYQVNLASKSKDKGRGRFISSYRDFVKQASRILNRLASEYDVFEADVQHGLSVLKPSAGHRLSTMWKSMHTDLADSYALLYFTADRVLGSGKTNRESYEEIYSVSDCSARFIKKGGRETIFGYKIQLGRSKNGFISSVKVPEGNVADSDMLLAMVKDQIARTGVTPRMVSTDDGYSSAAGKAAVKALGVGNVSLSGSKGKKLTLPEDWESDLYVEARNNRSAVESLMYTGKHCFDFGYFHRRDIVGIRCEMLAKTLAYNFWRIGHERVRQSRLSQDFRKKKAA